MESRVKESKGKVRIKERIVRTQLSKERFIARRRNTDSWTVEQGFQ